MKDIAIKIPGFGDIPVPTGISHIPSRTGPFGENIIQLIISVLLTGAILLSLFYLIWGGYEWIRSEGDKEAIQTARYRIIYSVIGLVVAFFSFLLINLISYFFGVDLIKK